jgi:S-DNA-T family DNA segregation ATPase FtsK/SpoIIIE
MAKRRKRYIRKDPLSYVALPKIHLESDTKKSILIIFLLALGAISFLSLFDLAGAIGVYLSHALLLGFGWGKWLVPLVLLVAGFLLYNEEKYYIRGINYLGFFVYLIAFEALLHFFVPFGLWRETIETGAGGGYLGYYSATIFNNLLGFYAGILVIIALVLVSLMLMFDTSLSYLIGRESIFAKIVYPFGLLYDRIFRRNDEGEEEPEEPIEIENEDEIESIEEDEAGFNKKAVSVEPEFMEDEKAEPRLKKASAENSLKPSHLKIDMPLDLLSSKVGKPTSGDIKTNALVIQRTLENFGIPVEMSDISVGPTVTQYTFKPAEGIKLAKITTLSNDLALALAAHPIRIEAPIPGKSLVGVEVPNQSKAVVGLREILESSDFKTRKTNLAIALGKDVSGKSWTYDLPRMPHLLVAGATNSGKSVCLNTIIVSLLYQNNPDDLRFIMVDPKRVELTVYGGIPHLLTPVITDVPKTVNALKWCLNEMDRRFELLSKHFKRNIQSYNEKASADEKMPYIVFIIDELADLMVAAGRDIEGSVIRLAQMARAVGIHLILATQRPSVDVITGLIKANMPARIAFSVASGVDSKTILDSLGAEKLLGQGDMLFVTAEISKPRRLQGAYVSDNEIKRIVNYIKDNSDGANYVDGITDRHKVKGIAGMGLDGEGGDSDELLEEAKELIINSGKASTSYLQRRLSIGYARAAKLIDLLEESGVVGVGNGSKPREVLVSREQYEAVVNQGVSGVSLHNRDEAEVPDAYLPADVETQDSASADDDAEDEEDDDEDNDEDEEMDDEEEKEIKQENKKTRKQNDNDDDNDGDVETQNLASPVPAKKKVLRAFDDDDEGMFFSK